MRQISSSFWVSKGFEIMYRCCLGKLMFLTQQPTKNRCAMVEISYLHQKPQDEKFAAKSMSFSYMKRSLIQDQAQFSSSIRLEMA